MRRSKRIAAYTLLALLLLVLASAFLITRPWFVRTQLLPRVGRRLGQPVSAERVVLRPFKLLELHGLQVGTGETACLRADMVRCRYRLGALLRGRLHIDELTVSGARIQALQAADGRWNLPSRPPADATHRPQPQREKKPARPAHPVIRNVSLRDVTVIIDRQVAPEPSRIELHHVALTLPEFAPGGGVRLAWSGEARGTRGAAIQLTHSAQTGSLNAVLGADCLPQELTFEKQVTDLAGHVRELDLAGRSTLVRLRLRRDGRGYKIDEFRIEERTGETLEALALVTGMVEPEPLRVQLDLKVDPIAPSVLNLLGGLLGGYDFGHTSGRYAGSLTARGRTALSAKGELTLTSLTFRAPGLQLPPVPPVDLRLTHDLALDLDQKRASLDRLSLTVQEQTAEVVRLELLERTTLAWGDGQQALAAAPTKVNLTVNGLRLALLAPLLPPDGPLQLHGGTLSMAVVTELAAMGRQMRSSGQLQVQQAELTVSGKRLPPLSADCSVAAVLKEFHALDNNWELNLSTAGQTALKLAAHAVLDLRTREGTIDLELPMVTDALLAALPVTWPPPGKPPVSGLNLTGNAALTLGPQGQLTAKGELQVPSLTLLWPDPATPARLRGDVAFDLTRRSSGAFDLRTCVLHLAQGPQPLLHLSLQGVLVAPGSDGASDLQVISDALQLQRLLALVRPPAAAAAAPPAPAEPAAKPAPAAEPAAIDLGGVRLTARLDLRNITYGELVAPQFKGTLTVADNTVTLAPLDLQLNGAPVHADRVQANLGVPGYQYGVTAFTVAALPLEPFIVTFAPALQEQVRGGIRSLDLTVSGAGITPPNLKRNLHGTLNLVGERVVLANLPFQESAAQVLGASGLQRLQFETVTVAATDEDGRIKLAQAGAVGPELRADTRGTVSFEGRLDLLVGAGVAGQLQQQFAGGPYTGLLGKRDGDYVVLRTPVPVRGRASELSGTRILKEYLKDALRDAGKEILGTVLKDAAEGKDINVRQVLESLAPTPAATPAPGTTAPAPAAPEPAAAAPALAPTDPAPTPETVAPATVEGAGKAKKDKSKDEGDKKKKKKKAKDGEAVPMDEVAAEPAAAEPPTAVAESAEAAPAEPAPATPVAAEPAADAPPATAPTEAAPVPDDH